MSVAIPLSRIASRAIRPRLFSGNQEGVLGGIDLQIPRLGDRFAVDIGTTQLRQDAEARMLIGALTEATTDDARIWLPQYDLGRGSMAGSAAVIDGAGQTGSVLNLRSVQRGAAILKYQYLTIVHGGVGFVYMARGQVIAGVDGKLALPIWPMLRFITVDGERAMIDTPYIEGRLVGFDAGATFARNRVEPLKFSIEERA
ncbi:MAG: hypothetical protein M3Y22_15165 [Pseudomonadota bacterium]|nr:hypothetical protein [Pseudomonadota bacterium]